MSQCKPSVTIDTEIYPNCFLLVAQICDTSLTFSYEVSQFRDDSKELMLFLQWLQFNNGRAYGFNIVGFDGPLIHLFMQMGGKASPGVLYDKAQAIINSQDDGDKFAHTVRPSDRAFEWVDLYRINHFNNRARATSLKSLEFNMRMDNIEDLPFPVGALLTREQIDVLKHYCAYDVRATELFRTKNLDAIRLREELSLRYDRDMMNHDDVKIGSAIFEIALENAGVQLYDFGPNGRTPRQTKRSVIHLKECIPKWITFDQPEFTRVLNWFKAQSITETKGVFTDITATVNGFTFVFGLGGIHGSVESEIIESDDEHIIIDLDVQSYYPNLSIKNRIYPEHLGEQFCDVYEQLFNARKNTKKGSSENAAYKLALNGTYGKSNDQFSVFYDPKFTMSITITGQLLLCVLAEGLMTIPGLKIIQVNTDGLTVRVPRTHKVLVDLARMAWQERTGLQLEEATYKTMMVADVNSYIAVYEDGSTKRKGRYEWKVGWHQNASALVVPKVAEKVLVEGAPIRQTVEQWPDIMDFMLRTKVPRSSYLQWGEQQVQNTSRYYIAKGGKPLIKWMPPLKGKQEWRRIGVESGWTVQVCNDIRDATLPVDFDYYVREVEKLTLCLA